MDKNEQSTFKSNPGSMLQIFLELNIIEQIKQIQKNENLKDEREVIIRAIQNYSKKNIDFYKPDDSSTSGEYFVVRCFAHFPHHL